MERNPFEEDFVSGLPDFLLVELGCPMKHYKKAFKSEKETLRGFFYARYNLHKNFWRWSVHPPRYHEIVYLRKWLEVMDVMSKLGD